jgi:hypothetical protein
MSAVGLAVVFGFEENRAPDRMEEPRQALRTAKR